MIWFLYGWLLVGAVWFAYLALEWAYRRGFRDASRSKIAAYYREEARVLSEADRRTKGPVV